MHQKISAGPVQWAVCTQSYPLVTHCGSLLGNYSDAFPAPLEGGSEQTSSNSGQGIGSSPRGLEHIPLREVMVWAPHEGGPKMDSVLSALLHPDPQRAKNQTLGLPAEEPSSSLLACKPAGMTKNNRSMASPSS